MAVAEAKRPRPMMAPRPTLVRTLTCSFHTMGMGIRAKRRSVAMLMDELKTPTFLKTSGS